jgi:hypothetical protein
MTNLNAKAQMAASMSETPTNRVQNGLAIDG